MKDIVVGVFDSGVGGLTTADTIRSKIPEAQIIYYNDHTHCPYGERSKAELLEITSEIVQNLKNQGAKIIVIACNTATTQCIYELRKLFPELSFVGTEPALKLACDAGCKNILLMGTPGTVSSDRVRRLVDEYSVGRDITLLPCPDLAKLIENSTSLMGREAAFSFNKAVQDKIDELLGTFKQPDAFDGVVLGCTHYIYVQSYIQKYFPKERMFDGNFGVAQRIQSLIQKIQED